MTDQPQPAPQNSGLGMVTHPIEVGPRPPCWRSCDPRLPHHGVTERLQGGPQSRRLVDEIAVEPDADHAFFNDTGPCYNAAAAADAWQRLLNWLGRYLPDH